MSLATFFCQSPTVLYNTSRNDLEDRDRFQPDNVVITQRISRLCRFHLDKTLCGMGERDMLISRNEIVKSQTSAQSRMIHDCNDTPVYFKPRS
jgi:hypothetical protein